MDMILACDSIFPGCDFEASAETEQELVDVIAEHAREVHQVTELTPDLLVRIKEAIEAEAVEAP